MIAFAALEAVASDDALQQGRAAMERQDFAAAAAAFLAQAAGAPADPEPHYWLASALMAGGQGEEGGRALDQARHLHAIAVIRELGADMGQFHRDAAYRAQLGRFLYERHLMGPASFVLGQAIDFAAPNPGHLLNYGLALQHQGRTAEAIDVFSAAAGIFKTPEVHQFLLYALFKAPDRLQRVSDEARRWAELYAAPATAVAPRFANDRSPGRRLRIGYYAPSLTRSQVATSTLPVFESHDPAAVEVFLYSANPAAEGPVPAHCTLRGLGDLSDEAAAALIRKDRIDILIDAWGHTAGSRLRTFALKPAPIQCGWINFMHTTGLPSMDYVLHADSMAVPGDDAYFSETIWRTGPVMAPYRPTAPASPPTPTPALTNGYVTYGSFNNPAKLSDETIAAWAAILRRRPADRLVLKYSYFIDPVLQRTTEARFAAHGVSPGRIAFRGHSQGADYVREFADIDLALDPSPCPGGTTTLDAICYGVPVLVLKGDDFYARTCLPLIEPCGLGELVAESWDDYVDRAIALTEDVAALSALRARVRPGFDASPYRDEIGFTRRLEEMYRQMFSRWAAEAGQISP